MYCPRLSSLEGEPIRILLPVSLWKFLPLILPSTNQGSKCCYSGKRCWRLVQPFWGAKRGYTLTRGESLRALLSRSSVSYMGLRSPVRCHIIHKGMTNVRDLTGCFMICYNISPLKINNTTTHRSTGSSSSTSVLLHPRRNTNMAAVSRRGLQAQHCMHK